MKSYLKKKIKNILKLSANLIKIINNPTPIFSERKKGIRLHLGSGEINLQGWINIDAKEDMHIHITEKDFKLNYFANNSISEIYLCHVLEHFTENEIKGLMTTFRDKLIKGGILRVSVPDFDRIIEIYNSGDKKIEKIHPILFGGQDNLYNYHKSAFNKDKLIRIFKEFNFKKVREWETKTILGSSIDDYSDQFIKVKNKKIPISLNICGEIMN